MAFRAQAGTEDLRLSSEDPAQEEGAYPRFERVAATQSQAIAAYHGRYAAAVTNAQTGPAIAIPVSDGDRLKVRVYCNTPHGVQYLRPGAARPLPALPPVVAVLLPALLPTTPVPAPDGRPTWYAPGLQLSVTGLLGALATKKAVQDAASAGQPGSGGGSPASPPLDAYLAWTLLSANGQTIRSGYQLVPVHTDGQWRPLDLVLTVDLSGEEARTGTLRLREVNEASQPVYFDSLTVTHPQDRALVSQEQHYYPFGLALSGVAVNTAAQPQPSKDQYNGGSELQDELLGSEQGIYSTFYRNYDPATGRFQGVDPLAEKYADESPYSFSFNDPINFNDPNGDDPREGGLFVNGRYVTPHVFGGDAGGWGGGGREGSVLGNMMQQGWVGTTGYAGSSGGHYEQRSQTREAMLECEDGEQGSGEFHTVNYLAWVYDDKPLSGHLLGLSQWAGNSGLTAWGVREFYYGPNVRALSQYYDAPLEIRIQASQMRNDIIMKTRKITPQPYKSMAEAIKRTLSTNPDGNFAKPNSVKMWQMRGVGAGSSLLMGYGIYYSAKTIINASNRSTAATQQSIIWVNSLAFGSLGASAGAAIGVGFFGIGAAPGAVIGGVVGSIGGGIYGAWMSGNYK